MNTSGTLLPGAAPRRVAVPAPARALILSVALVAAGCSHPHPTGTPQTATTPPALAVPPTPVATPKPAPPAPPPLVLFDGKSLTGWLVTDFAGKGDVRVENGQLILEQGYMTGITWTNPVPRADYEIELEAQKTDGGDFFCGLTFPVGTNHCSFIVGGWGGGVVGLSNLDGEDAAHNDTTKYMAFNKGQWYRIRVRVQPARIQAWINQERVVDAALAGRAVGIRTEMEECTPLGVANWNTGSALRNLSIRHLTAAELAAP